MFSQLQPITQDSHSLNSCFHIPLQFSILFLFKALCAFFRLSCRMKVTEEKCHICEIRAEDSESDLQ